MTFPNKFIRTILTTKGEPARAGQVPPLVREVPRFSSTTGGSKLRLKHSAMQNLEFRMNPCGPIWDGFNGGYSLPEDEVHVWRTSLEMAASDLAKLRPLDLPANKLQFEYDEFGNPSLVPRQGLPLQFTFPTLVT